MAIVNSKRLVYSSILVIFSRNFHCEPSSYWLPPFIYQAMAINIAIFVNIAMLIAMAMEIVEIFP